MFTIAVRVQYSTTDPENINAGDLLGLSVIYSRFMVTWTL